MKSNEFVEKLRDLDLFQYVSLGEDAIKCYFATGKQAYLDEYFEMKKCYEFYIDEDEVPFDKARQILANFFHNKNKVVKRVENRIEYILQNANDIYEPYFITLTFDDSKYNYKLHDYKNIRRDIRELLKQYCKVYVANKDYGVVEFGTHRLHFHGVVLISSANKSAFEEDYNKNYGFTYFEYIDNKSRAISKYVTKLTYHFVKDSTRRINRENLIYSRLD